MSPWPPSMVPLSAAVTFAIMDSDSSETCSPNKLFLPWSFLCFNHRDRKVTSMCGLCPVNTEVTLWVKWSLLGLDAFLPLCRDTPSTSRTLCFCLSVTRFLCRHLRPIKGRLKKKKKLFPSPFSVGICLGYGLLASREVSREFSKDVAVIVNQLCKLLLPPCLAHWYYLPGRLGCYIFACNQVCSQ